MRLWNFMGGRRNTMVWAAFILAGVCLFVSKAGKPIATFSEWTVFVLPLIGLLVAGIVTEEKFDKVKAVELAKVAGAADIAKAEGVAEVNKIVANDSTPA